MHSGIVIWAEITREEYLHTVVFELSSKACELSKKLDNCEVMALLLVKPNMIDKYKEAFCVSGFDKIYYVESELFEKYRADIYYRAAIEAVKKINPEIMFIGATNQGRDIAPRISSALHTGLTADCTALDIVDGKLAATRPTFGGQLMATILSKTTPQMATVRPKVFKPATSDIAKNTEFIKLDVDLSDINSAIEILEFKKRLNSELNEIDSAEIIVAGGRGMQSKQGFDLLKKLADKLGGVVGASRVAVEMGLASKECQIGQTGKTVTPKLYIACGISGALQHTVGMENSTKIIAINKDKNAPIFEISDYGYVGDAFEVIPQLLEIL